MKHLKIIFRTILLLLTVNFGVLTALAQTKNATIEFKPEYYDSVEISLLTCQPHDEVYSLYGHTAIRYRDSHSEKPIDLAFNYGVFNFKKPFFVARFVFGLTDYELGVIPFRFFQDEYRRFGSMVVEQVLNLTNEEKQKLYCSLAENLQPENCIYRYNYFYNNCTTKARDIIEQCINGKIEYAGREGYTPSYREMVHTMTRNNPWSRFGNDVLLGFQADEETTLRQQEFLPDNLMYDFDRAQIYKDGTYRPLVKERLVSVPAGVQVVSAGFPLSPSACSYILAVLGVVLFLLEWRRRRTFLLWDILLMLVTGTIGIVLLLMLFSQHPTVSLNLQFILFNPLPWLFLWQVIRRKPTHYWLITACLSLLFLFVAVLRIQVCAEGLWSLALCLLLQCCIHLQPQWPLSVGRLQETSLRNEK